MSEELSVKLSPGSEVLLTINLYGTINGPRYPNQMPAVFFLSLSSFLIFILCLIIFLINSSVQLLSCI